jgi:hypothetical protein
VQEADGVEGDVDAVGAVRYRVGVLVDGLLVQRVDLRCLDHASRGGDLPGDLVQLGERAPGQEDPCSLTGEATMWVPVIRLPHATSARTHGLANRVDPAAQPFRLAG